MINSQQTAGQSAGCPIPRILLAGCVASILIAQTAVAWPAEPERTILKGAAAEATSFATFSS